MSMSEITHSYPYKFSIEVDNSSVATANQSAEKIEKYKKNKALLDNDLKEIEDVAQNVFCRIKQTKETFQYKIEKGRLKINSASSENTEVNQINIKVYTNPVSALFARVFGRAKKVRFGDKTITVNSNSLVKALLHKELPTLSNEDLKSLAKSFRNHRTDRLEVQRGTLIEGDSYAACAEGTPLQLRVLLDTGYKNTSINSLQPIFDLVLREQTLQSTNANTSLSSQNLTTSRNNVQTSLIEAVQILNTGGKKEELAKKVKDVMFWVGTAVGQSLILQLARESGKLSEESFEKLKEAEREFIAKKVDKK